jgi:proline iminopeptidase
VNCRSFLATGAGSAVLGAASNRAIASSESHQSPDIPTLRPDGLNPPGIRTAGIRMLPVVNGKYKVWTKRMGSGPSKYCCYIEVR